MWQAQSLDCSHSDGREQAQMVLPDTESVRNNLQCGCGLFFLRPCISSKGRLDALCGLVRGLECQPGSHPLVNCSHHGQGLGRISPVWAAEYRARVWQLWVQILPQPLLPEALGKLQNQKFH